MGNRRPPRPTDAELAILRVLWRVGTATVREVQKELAGRPRPGYTTVLKLMQIMTDKGLVVRDESRRAHVYRSRYGEERTQQLLVGDLVDRAFDGSASRLVVQALASRPASADELEELRALLREMEEQKR